MNLKTQRVVFQPGAVASGTAISLPTGYQAARYTHAEIQRYDHQHTSLIVTTGAGSATATAAVQGGDGSTPSTVPGMGVAALPGANVNVQSSTITNVPAIVAATATYVSATSFSLSVATEASDILVLDIVPVGEMPQYI